ncbi:hypothetical protein SeMB42_g02237 [Synchytrium endobioticum]|uniref:tRNA-splicing endonuclease subunit Sen34 n=1 Tax=Synchytrium endobioticum TaxID=286115 RepID=A0A507DH31_9FUNG|nr:hypothetical protein SeMB42_g02237 [Synchytrium endobioticum]TPX50999.1 hypothetical protein SeLEV6574_g00562 [Synchytrium endobioticum]
MVSTSAPSEPHKPTVYILNGRTFIWDARSAITLRKNFRIVGALIGTLPRLPSQNIYLGLPIELSLEEVSHLLSINAIDLIDDAACLQTPTEHDMQILDDRYQSELHIYLSQRARVSELRSIQGRELYAARTRNGITQKIKPEQHEEPFAGVNVSEQDIATGDGGAGGRTSSSIAVAGSSLDSDAEPETLPPPRKPLPTLPPPPVSIYTSSTPLPWYAPTPLRSSQIPSEYTTPTLASKIYSDLWNRGYYVAAGSKFGGKWLVYPGDPMRYHSNHVVNIVPREGTSSDGGTDMKELVAGGRLGGTVKKQYVLASWDDARDEAVYFCIEWTGWL